MVRMSEGSGWKTRNLSRNPFQNGSIFHSHDIVDQLILGKLLSGKLLNKALTSLTGLFLIWGNIQRLFHKESVSTDKSIFFFLLFSAHSLHYFDFMLLSTEEEMWYVEYTQAPWYAWGCSSVVSAKYVINSCWGLHNF